MKDPNRLRFPPRTDAAFREGWRACEAGAAASSNPHPRESYANASWDSGFHARAEVGFETAHLPRKPFSDAFAF